MDKKFSDFFEMINLLVTLSNLIEFLGMDKDEKFEIQVKGKVSKNEHMSILPSLKKIKENINDLFSNNNSKIELINEGIDEWIKIFEKEYSIKSRFWKLPETLREGDIKPFQDDLISWIKLLHKVSESQIIPANIEPTKINPILTKDLKRNSKADIKDAMKCMDLRLYTPAYMLFLRVAEEEVKSYYTKITGSLPTGTDAAWGNMLHELAENHKKIIGREIINILFNLKTKRNEAQHPGKRFTKDDCEEIIPYLIVLKKGIRKRKSI